MKQTLQQRLAEYVTAKINATTTTSISDVHNRIYYTNKYLVSVCGGLSLIEWGNIFEETITDLDVSVLTLWDRQKPEHNIKCVMCMGVITTLIISIELNDNALNKINCLEGL